MSDRPIKTDGNADVTAYVRNHPLEFGYVHIPRKLERFDHLARLRASDRKNEERAEVRRLGRVFREEGGTLRGVVRMSGIDLINRLFANRLTLSLGNNTVLKSPLLGDGDGGDIDLRPFSTMQSPEERRMAFYGHRGLAHVLRGLSIFTGSLLGLQQSPLYSSKGRLNDAYSMGWDRAVDWRQFGYLSRLATKPEFVQQFSSETFAARYFLRGTGLVEFEEFAFYALGVAGSGGRIPHPLSGVLHHVGRVLHGENRKESRRDCLFQAARLLHHMSTSMPADAFIETLACSTAPQLHSLAVSKVRREISKPGMSFYKKISATLDHIREHGLPGGVQIVSDTEALADLILSLEKEHDDLSELYTILEQHGASRDVILKMAEASRSRRLGSAQMQADQTPDQERWGACPTASISHRNLRTRCARFGSASQAAARIYRIA